MSKLSCRRPLTTNILAEEFVVNVLQIFENYTDPGQKIVDAELKLEQLEKRPTHTHTDYRDKNYRSEDQRELLRSKILAELITEIRLDNDDEITLGHGGAKPEKEKREYQAYIVSGSPASGKSGIAARLAKENGAFILDSDYAKRKFPEYLTHGASIVHQESDDIIFGSKSSLFEYCICNGYNIVIPIVGKTVDSMEKIFKRLEAIDYKIHIINVSLDRYKSVSRAYQRFINTKRYVPLSYVFDDVGNEPERVYFLIKRKFYGKANFRSFAQISTDVAPGETPKILECSDESPVRVWSV